MKTNFMTIEVRGLKQRVKRLSDALFDINRTHGEGVIAHVTIEKMTPTRISGHVIRHIPRAFKDYDVERLPFRSVRGRVHFIQQVSPVAR